MRFITTVTRTLKRFIRNLPTGPPMKELKPSKCGSPSTDHIQVLKSTILRTLDGLSIA